jgi:hypothetical protein
MSFALVVEVDNSGEDPEEGRRRLREELAPAVKQLPGFRSLLFMTAFDRGFGIGVVVFDDLDQAEQAAAGLAVATSPREGVTVKRTEVLTVEVSA